MSNVNGEEPYCHRKQYKAVKSRRIVSKYVKRMLSIDFDKWWGTFIWGERYIYKGIEIHIIYWKRDTFIWGWDALGFDFCVVYSALVLWMGMIVKPEQRTQHTPCLYRTQIKSPHPPPASSLVLLPRPPSPSSFFLPALHPSFSLPFIPLSPCPSSLFLPRYPSLLLPRPPPSSSYLPHPPPHPPIIPPLYVKSSREKKPAYERLLMTWAFVVLCIYTVEWALDDVLWIHQMLHIKSDASIYISLNVMI